MLSVVWDRLIIIIQLTVQLRAEPVPCSLLCTLMTNCVHLLLVWKQSVVQDNIVTELRNGLFFLPNQEGGWGVGNVNPNFF